MFDIMATRDPYPVLCDRCGAEGLAGEAEFERLAGLGDLLDFEPVPRRVARADGWTPEIQRAYVAALAVTGSERQACTVVGRAQFGISQLRKAEGSESFFAACDKAMEIWRERERVRRSDNLLAAAYGEAARTRPRLAWSAAATRRLPPPDPALDPEVEEKAALELLETLARGIWIKLRDERRARLQGRIVAADFYLRQITWLEVALDLAADDSTRMWKELHRGGTHVLDIAATPLSRILDSARRLAWGEAGDPDRPDPPEPERLADHRDFFTEPREFGGRVPAESLKEQQRRLDEQHEIEAKAQVEWEAEALRDYERRRDSDAANNQEPGEAGQPAPERRQD